MEEERSTYTSKDFLVAITVITLSLIIVLCLFYNVTRSIGTAKSPSDNTKGGSESLISSGESLDKSSNKSTNKIIFEEGRSYKLVFNNGKLYGIEFDGDNSDEPGIITDIIKWLKY